MQKQRCPGLRVGKMNEPITKQIEMSSVILSSGRENNSLSSLYSRISVSNFECVCDIDVLGLEENH